MEQDLVLQHTQTQQPEHEAPAPSPFLPGTVIQVAWDSTSLGWLKTCPRLYQYQMIEGWVTSGEAVHLRFGIEFHQALHDYENSKAAGIPHDDALHDTVRALLTRIFDWKPSPTTKSEELKSKEHLLRSVIWYIDKFEHDPAETYIMANGKPALEVSFKFELDWGPKAATNRKEYIPGDTISIPDLPYLLCGHLDRIVKFNGEYFVMDRKTTGTTPGSYFFDQFEPNNQMTLYTLASQIVLHSPIRGVIIDAVQVAVGFSRPVRGFTYRTPEQLQEWVNDLKYWFALAEGYATEGYWPQNDTACDKFGGCRFRQICSKSPQVRAQFLKSNYVQLPQAERWNPVKPR